MSKDNNTNRDSLSINRFRDVDVDALSDEDYQDYVLAKLMQAVIQRLEGSIQNDRIFSRTKFDVMASFWESRELLRAHKKEE